MNPQTANTGSVAETLLPRLDAVGATASFLCALHCATLPVMMSTLPLAGVEFLGDHRFERGFVIFASLFGLLVIGSGYCRHRIAAVGAIYLGAVAALISGAYFTDGGIAHAVLLTTGGVLLGTAHTLNRRGVRFHACARNAFRVRSPGSEASRVA